MIEQSSRPVLKPDEVRFLKEMGYAVDHFCEALNLNPTITHAALDGFRAAPALPGAERIGGVLNLALIVNEGLSTKAMTPGTAAGLMNGALIGLMNGITHEHWVDMLRECPTQELAVRTNIMEACIALLNAHPDKQRVIGCATWTFERLIELERGAHRELQRNAPGSLPPIPGDSRTA